MSSLSALIGVMGIFPIRFGTVCSDGYRLWEAIHGGTARDRAQRDALTIASISTALRVRDWPNDLVRRLADTPTDAHSRHLDRYLAYIHFLDGGDTQTAGRYLDALMEDWAPNDPPEYALEAAYFHALHRNDLATARKWWNLETREAEPWVRLRAQAAIERAADNPKKARVLIDEAMATLKARSACGAYRYEMDRLRECEFGFAHA